MREYRPKTYHPRRGYLRSADEPLEEWTDDDPDAGDRVICMEDSRRVILEDGRVLKDQLPDYWPRKGEVYVVARRSKERLGGEKCIILEGCSEDPEQSVGAWRFGPT